ncbi:MAG: porphobilinogen synthase [Bacillota bacterium]
MKLAKRPRRLRKSKNIRSLIRETQLNKNDLIYPLFVVNGENVSKEVPAMPDVYHMSINNILKEVEKLVKLGIKGIILFGIPDYKDEIGSSAWQDDGIVQRTVKKIKEKFPDFLVITDICLCQYTSHGHCGIIEDGRVKNKESLNKLAKIALSHAKAGADMLAPSDMMDGRVTKIRNKLDKNNYKNTAIMAYSAKYQSAFYGPFRNAAHSAPEKGDRSSYQMDIANKKEALKEIELDIKEGADIVMVKPALSYLDIIKEVADNYNFPLAAYNVSGEYAMVKAAAKNNWIDEKKVALEILTSIKRAGAEIIISYWAKDVAKWI